MRGRATVLASLAMLLAAPAAHAQPGPSRMAAILGAHDWDLAARVAARSPDPVAPRLVSYLRMLTPGAAGEAEIAAFIDANPDWPNRALLERRRQEALAADPDDGAVLRACARRPPTLAAALLRCAEGRARANDAAGASEAARAAWVGGGIAGAPAETAFMQRWATAIGPDAQWARFERLAWTDTDAAARQLLRLDPARRRAAEARLAFRRDEPGAPTLAATLPATERAAPGLVLEHTRYLRRAGRDAEALALWLAQGSAAERAAPAEQRAAFWAERNILARRLLRAGDAAGAYALAAGHAQTAAEPAADAEFFAGFVALRFLHDPARARAHFSALAALSRAAITQGRAEYWLGRAMAAAGEDPAPAYARAAAWPTTFYGQLAAAALAPDAPDAVRARLAQARDPAFSREAAIDFAGRELVRAALILLDWGEPGRARAFLLRADETAEDTVTRTLVANLSLGLDAPQDAVAVARRMGRDGAALPVAGWPAPVHPPAAVDPALALGLIRQESSFDAEAVSPSGARGLMQLMPATARAVARQTGEADPVAALTAEPSLNMRLGVEYLRGLLTQFGGAAPLAVAAYNAGPNRVRAWLEENGDPRPGSAKNGAVDMIDWIELIPFGETRNYVQRVLENRAIYAARAGETVTLAAAR